MHEIFTVALFCSAVLSLLVALALVVYVLKPTDPSLLGDQESFSSMAVKESRERGLWPISSNSGSTSTLQLQPSRPNKSTNKTKTKQKMKQQETTTAGTADTKTGQKPDLTSEIRLMKHMEIVKWRQDNERILSASSDSFLSTQSPQTVKLPESQPKAPLSNPSEKSDTTQSNNIDMDGE